MFVRVKSTPNSHRQSVQIVASVRDGQTVKQRIVRHIGIAMDDDELVRLKHLAEVVKAKLQAQTQPELFTPEATAQQVIAARPRTGPQALKVDLKQLRETQRVVTGIHAVYGALYEELGLHRLLPRYRYRASHRALFHSVMARLANPGSKRHSVRRLEEDFGVQLPLEQVYRMMDQLDESRIKRLNTLAGQQAQAFLGRPLTVLFFDCTTLYFESFTEDELKQKGYSKDAKFNECQVLLALLVTEAGLTVHYEVLPGATFEEHSLVPVVRSLQAKYDVQQVVCVADRGMLSEANLQALEEAGIHYIVGAKLTQLPKTQQARILDDTHYQPLGDDGGRVLSFPHQSRRVLVRYSPVRAEKDRHDRHTAITKLLKKLAKSNNPKDLLNNYGYKKYLQVKGETELGIDQDKVEQAQRWDGLHRRHHQPAGYGQCDHPEPIPWPVAGGGDLPGNQTRPESPPHLSLDPGPHPRPHCHCLHDLAVCATPELSNGATIPAGLARGDPKCPGSRPAQRGAASADETTLRHSLNHE